MEIKIGEVAQSWQDEFPTVVKCFACGGTARLVLSVCEQDETKYICDLYKPQGEEMWPHDAIAMSVYFCPNCLHPTTKWNQA